MNEVEYEKFIEAVDTVCMNCIEYTLDNDTVCDYCPVAKTYKFWIKE